ncbi:putative NIF3 family GTP cyclohydrolase 1 type 2 [Mycoplasmopsis mustelae]|uniref:GTP cyclohydrolase 1 type 2 homolog n=1 Tax=Mycoplasmopsis mustelae TaxID=171289 RepID=A0A4R7UCZ6_9BACT|nr:Nif3-like dinuclear metal center hexameric protein [Mycoplasmopsis mustelae]TDV24342.1 putative NIF3 family GTP cyclohydrolase 1 type 2 [Mycoplasmopsis mustelae]
MTIKQVIEFLEAKFPIFYKEDWDPSGYALKTKQNKKITGIMIALDLNMEVYQAAITHQCNLIITHHPFVFEKTRSEIQQKAPYKIPILKMLRINQITAYSIHTNFDNFIHGTSYQIAYQLGLKDFIKVEDNQYYVIVDIKLSINEILKLLKNQFNLQDFRSNFKYLDTKFTELIFFAGSGDIVVINELSQKHKHALFITSDIKWSDWITYSEQKTAILEIPHLIEQVFVNYMYNLLINSFDNLPIFKYELSNLFYNLKF